MKVLITGATGFVGRALVARLRDEPDMPLRAIVRIQTQIDGVECRVGALAADADYSEILSGVDAVVHLAALVHVPGGDEAAFMALNHAATVRLAQQAAQAGCKRFVFISTIGVHGTVADVAVSETSPTVPDSPYAASKLAAEQSVQDICTQTGMEFVIVRPPMIYGAGAPGNFSLLAKAVARGLPLPFGIVKNGRSFVFVENLADFLSQCLHGPAAANQVFLVADNEAVSTADLVRAMARALGKRSFLLPVPVSLMQLGARLVGKSGMADSLLGSLALDTAKAKTVLGWQPPYTFEDGVQRALGHKQQEETT